MFCHKPPPPTQVEFEFKDPQEIDFLGLKALLKNYLVGGLLTTSSQPTLDTHLLLLRAPARAFTLKVVTALVSVECLFSLCWCVPGLHGIGTRRVS